jgi:hypothetical protein
MARLQYVLLAEYARVDAGGLLTIAGAGFDHIVVPAIPGSVAMACALRVLLREDEKSTRLAITIRPPQGPGLALESVVSAPEEAKAHQGEVGVAFAATFGLPITAAGIYSFSVSVDGVESERLSFEAEVQSPPEQADA